MPSRSESETRGKPYRSSDDAKKKLHHSAKQYYDEEHLDANPENDNEGAHPHHKARPYLPEAAAFPSPEKKEDQTPLSLLQPFPSAGFY